MASLEVLLGVAAAVVLLGVIAVRAVRPAGPALAAALPRHRRPARRVGARAASSPTPRSRESLGLAALVLILVEGGLTTRWTAVRPSLGVGIALSTVAVVVSIGVVGVGAAPPAGPGVAHRVPVGCRAVLDRRRRGVQRAARGRGRPAPLRRARAGVRHERRAGGARGRPAGLRTTRSRGSPRLLVVYELVAGGLIGGVARLRRGVGAATGRAAVDRASTRSPRSRSACSPTRPASSRTRPGCSPPTWPRSCWATPTCRTAAACGRSPRAPAGSRRSACSCCSGSYVSPPRLVDAVVPALVAGVVLILLAARRCR